jgi:hypothetical protein
MVFIWPFLPLFRVWAIVPVLEIQKCKELAAVKLTEILNMVHAAYITDSRLLVPGARSRDCVRSVRPTQYEDATQQDDG